MKRFLLVTLIIASMILSACAGTAETQATETTEEAPVQSTESQAADLEADTDQADTKDGQETQAKVYEPQTYTYEIYGETYEVTYTEPPKRAVTMSQFMTEMLLALDLGDQMVGTAYMDNEIYPDFKEAYEKIEVLSDKYPSKEVMYSVEPDFVSGWTSVFNEKRVASASEMMENGIHPFLAKSISGDGSMASVYEDFRTLGKIFAVEERAEDLVIKMENEVAKIQSQIGDLSEDDMVKVFAYDSGENEPFVVAGGGVSGDIIRQAKGKNIFGDIKKGYATVSWEEVVLQNPDVIVIVDYGDTSAETKLDLIKTHPALQDVTAVKEDNFVVIGLAEMSPGVRNTMAIRTLAQGFYPEKFE